MSRIFTVAKKELWSYFSTPTAMIFLGAYLFVSLFTFFWVEKFFSRNIADLRPLFEWMPVLLIFLISTLTMKMWSEERRAGTVEFLMTLPIKTHELVLGKFLACMSLVVLALFLTIGLAISVSFLGNVDWGPVWGAYLASLLLAGAYTSIGLYISSKTESQIISLILTSITCLVFYMIGSDLIVGFFGNQSGGLLKLFGSGSRFSSISRGVVDFRDIYYYTSIAATFLVLNTFALDKLKHAKENLDKRYLNKNTTIALLIANLMFANIWLYHVRSVRLDMTDHKIYSISEASKNLVTQLQEPLLIRGYFSERTHPLLAPLVPTIKDLLYEYQLIGRGKVRTEIVDPRTNEAVEAEANRKYNIEPVPFQIADRHSAAMVNSYFNIVVQYGSKYEVLGFNDLIAVKHDGHSKVEVLLKNLEYDITRSIKKVLHSFNNTDNLFAGLDHPIKFVAYVSEQSLPDQLATLNDDIKVALNEYKQEAQAKLEVEFLDPSRDEVLAQEISDKYGFAPQAMSLLSQDTFYFYLTIQDGNKIYSLGVPEDFQISSFKKGMEAALKRMSPGFLRTVGVVNPPSPGYNPMLAQYGVRPSGKQFKNIQQKLSENFRTVDVDLDSGVVDSEVDILMVLAPKEVNNKQLFALDQFLMKGGTVILATSPVSVSKSREGFTSENYDSGLNEWLNHYGIEIPKELVLDESNSGFPAIRKRVVQGLTIKEPYLAPYPFFVDVRNAGLNQDNPITSGLDQITMPWVSPIIINEQKTQNKKVVHLITSSNKSWRTTNTDIDPDRVTHPEYGFPISDKKESSILAAMVQGQFSSYFAGKPSPLIQVKENKKELEEQDSASSEEEDKEKEEEKIGMVTSVIDKSPNIARLIVFASNEMIEDDTVQINSMLNGTQYLNALQLVENTLDWSTADSTLLSLRNQGHFARTLEPLEDKQKRNWELLNYIIALLGLLAVYGVFRIVQRQTLEGYEKKLNLV